MNWGDHKRGQGEPRRGETELRCVLPDAGFGSFFLGGFECSTKVRADGRRLDLLASTGHATFFDEDYRALRRLGILAARDGLRWHMIEATPGQYDWSSFLPMLRAARSCGLEIIWDLCHYGWPDWLDIWSPAFVDSFARFAGEAARVVGSETGAAPFFCPINEISFWAWAGGDVGRFAPACRDKGPALKRQLVRASIAATQAVKHVNAEARFIHAEPLIHIEPASSDASDIALAERVRLGQFEALDMMSGLVAPELGGRPEYLDLVGLNFYPDNQWYLGGSTIPLGHHSYRPLRQMLAEVHRRYGRPLMLAETGAEGSARASWLHYVTAEVDAAARDGVPIQGITIYPVLDYPGWSDDRACAVGLLSAPDEAGRRRVDGEFAAELKRQQVLRGDAALPWVSRPGNAA